MTKLLDQTYGNVRVLIEHLGGSGPLPPPALPRRVWRRAMGLMEALGQERALDVADARAERALIRGDLARCARWRDLIVAIHAVTEDERAPGEASH